MAVNYLPHYPTTMRDCRMSACPGLLALAPDKAVLKGPDFFLLRAALKDLFA